jgi:5'-3' exonuclease
LFKIVTYLLKYKIIPLFIFDGKTPEIKKNTIQTRNNKKEKANNILINEKDTLTNNELIKNKKRSTIIKYNNFKECQLLLTHMGIPFIIAPEEADAQCAVISRLPYDNIGGIISDDTDILVFGGIKLLKNFNMYTNTYSEYDINTIIYYMNQKANNIIHNYNYIITHNDFIKFCILLGNDYTSGIKWLGYDKIFEYLVKNYFDINKLLSIIYTNEKLSYKINRINDVYNYYLCSKVINPFNINIVLSFFDINKTIDLLNNKNNINKNFIINTLNNIKS